MSNFETEKNIFLIKSYLDIIYYYDEDDDRRKETKKIIKDLVNKL